MTKIITIPLTHETCNKIKYVTGMALLGLTVIGLSLFFIGLWYDSFHMQIPDRVMLGTFSLFGLALAVTAFLIFLHHKGIWINFQCSCEEKKI